MLLWQLSFDYFSVIINDESGRKKVAWGEKVFGEIF
jgi:hypothetical protein